MPIVNERIGKSALSPTFYPGLESSDNGITQRRRYFAYEQEDDLVVGTATSILFSLDQPVEMVWPIFKDFNQWQNAYHHFYSGVVGDLEGGTVTLTVGADQNDPNRPSGQYHVVRVVPEHVIVKSQVRKPREIPGKATSPGIGGFMVFLLAERESRTFVDIMMQHDELNRGTTLDEALRFWRDVAPDNLVKWRDYFVPTLVALTREKAGRG